MPQPWFKGRSEEIVVALCCEVWGIGGSDAEAAYYADIDKSTLCRYLASHPEVAQRKEKLLERPVLLARKAIIEAFDGHEVKVKKGKKIVKFKSLKNADLALKYLERKQKSEFAPRSEVSGPDGQPLNPPGPDLSKIPTDKLKLIREILNGNSDSGTVK